jgi:hypothetical protein
MAPRRKCCCCGPNAGNIFQPIPVVPPRPSNRGFSRGKAAKQSFGAPRLLANRQPSYAVSQQIRKRLAKSLLPLPRRILKVKPLKNCGNENPGVFQQSAKGGAILIWKGSPAFSHNSFPFCFPAPTFTLSA